MSIWLLVNISFVFNIINSSFEAIKFSFLYSSAGAAHNNCGATLTIIQETSHCPASISWWWIRGAIFTIKVSVVCVMNYCCCHWNGVCEQCTHTYVHLSLLMREPERVYVCERIFSAINYSASGGAPPAALCHKNNYSRSPAIKVDLWPPRRTKSATARTSHNNCAQVSLNCGENVGTNCRSDIQL